MINNENVPNLACTRTGLICTEKSRRFARNDTIIEERVLPVPPLQPWTVRPGQGETIRWAAFLEDNRVQSS